MKTEFSYFKICQDLLGTLPQRQKEIISRRYGLRNNRRETLELIGKEYSVTRERVRQIEKESFQKIKPKNQKIPASFSVS